MNDAIKPDPKILEKLHKDVQLSIMFDEDIVDTKDLIICVSYFPYNGEIRHSILKPTDKRSKISPHSTIKDCLMWYMDDLHRDDNPEDLLEIIRVDIYFPRDTEAKKFDTMVEDFIDKTIKDYNNTCLEDRISDAIRLVHAKYILDFWTKSILRDDDKDAKDRIKELLKPFKEIPEF